jgi:quercetin dioxygenase-like cupin family protein
VIEVDPEALSEPAAQALAVLVDGLPPVAPLPHVRAALLAELAGPERYTPSAAAVAQHFGLAPAEARDALRRIASKDAWTPGPWPGSQLILTESLLKVRAMIARLPAGTQIARHRHAHRELTYILDGALSTGQVHFGQGELMDMQPGSEHEVAIAPDSDCLVVFAGFGN